MPVQHPAQTGQDKTIKIALSLGLWAAFCWLAICLWLWLRQEQLIFYPRPLATGSAELANWVLNVTAADGTSLSGWALPAADDKAPVIIYFGGNAEEISAQLTELHEKLGVSVAGVNYRGYGASAGAPSEKALQADALAGFDAALAKLGATADQTIVFGRSLGSHMAAFVAAHRPVAGLILVTPFDSVQELAADRYWMFPVRRMIRHPFDTVALSAQISAPTHLYIAEFDAVVPHRSTNRLLDAWRGAVQPTMTTISTSNHIDILDMKSLWDHARSLIRLWSGATTRLL